MTVPASGLRIVPLPVAAEVRAGADLAALALEALRSAGEEWHEGDVLAVSQKIVSKAEDRWRPLGPVRPSEQALVLAERTGKDPRIVELVLSESAAVLRAVPGVLIVRHRLGFVLANAGIDQSNLGARDEPGALLLPEDPDASAAALREALHKTAGWAPAILICDSFGRAWRLGVVGTAIGAAGLTCLDDRRGEPDRDGRLLAITEVARADALAAAAGLVMGEGDEGTPLVLIRGAIPTRPGTGPQPARVLVRPPAMDLFP
jgi:coenzyme F420-0:L-glutamate ligase/coenzyme F420-1:gamma-L-glutamate ligase